MASIRKREWTSRGAINARGSPTTAMRPGCAGKDLRHPQGRRPVPGHCPGRGRVRHAYPESTSKTLGEAVELWLQRAEADGLERATLDQYRQHRAHMLAAIPADTKLAQITQARCEQLRDDLLASHSRAMARKLLQSFKAVLKDAKRRGLVAQNVAPGPRSERQAAPARLEVGATCRRRRRSRR